MVYSAFIFISIAFKRNLCQRTRRRKGGNLRESRDTHGIRGNKMREMKRSRKNRVNKIHYRQQKEKNIRKNRQKEPEKWLKSRSLVSLVFFYLLYVKQRRWHFSMTFLRLGIFLENNEGGILNGCYIRYLLFSMWYGLQRLISILIFLGNNAPKNLRNKAARNW
jgi:hypothetical protein